MPRFPRNYTETSFFHIITQGINKSFIFNNEEDIKYYIKTMYNLTEEQKIKIIGYCIMSNHAHMLIQADNLKELSKYMQRLNTRYGIYYNKRYNRVGYVFRDRYLSEGIYNEKYFYNCLKYIFNNPVKAGICKNPKDYKYSNCKHVNIDFDNSEDIDYTFLDIDQDNKTEVKYTINNFLAKNNIIMDELKENHDKLKVLTSILKEKYNISLRTIANELNVNREKLRRIYNQK